MHEHRGDDFRATDRFEWVVNAAPRGSGWKKRKALLRALAEAWGAAAQEDAEEMPIWFDGWPSTGP